MYKRTQNVTVYRAPAPSRADAVILSSACARRSHDFRARVLKSCLLSRFLVTHAHAAPATTRLDSVAYRAKFKVKYTHQQTTSPAHRCACTRRGSFWVFSVLSGFTCRLCQSCALACRVSRSIVHISLDLFGAEPCAPCAMVKWSAREERKRHRGA